jgi:hypothetical protein
VKPADLQAEARRAIEAYENAQFRSGVLLCRTGTLINPPVRWAHDSVCDCGPTDVFAIAERVQEPQQQCESETRSWDHFTPEQADSYWIRCTLSGKHDEHEDEHTGLTWVDLGPMTTETNPSGGAS